MVLCAGCAQPARSRLDDETFTCPTCGLTQRTLRIDGAVTSLVAKTFSAASYRELDAVGRAFGVDQSCSVISFSCDGLRLNLSLAIDSGVVRGVDLDTETRGLPPVVFRPETGEHRRAKASGLARELQTGDPEFDARVYVETEAAETDVAVMLSSPAVREAIVRLLAHRQAVVVRSGNVVAERSTDEPACYGEKRLREELAALRVVAGAPRPVQRTAVDDRALSRTRFAYGMMLPIALALFIPAIVRWTPLDEGRFVLVSLVIGLVLALIPRAIFLRLLAGRSTSHTDFALAQAIGFLSVPFATAGLLLIVNGAFDRSAERTRTLSVSAVRWDEDDDARVTAISEGEEREFTFRDGAHAIARGDAVFVFTKRGRLGLEWKTRAVVVRSRAGELED